MEKPTLARKATPQNTSDIQVESAIKRSVKSVSKQAIKRKEYDEETLPVTFHAPKGGVQMIILSKDVAVYDPATKKNRGIRYCPQEASIWKDEQSKESVVEPVVFENGYLIVPRTKPNLIEYLRAHPSNGTKYHELKKEVKQEATLEDETAIIEAKSIVLKTPVEDLLAIAMHYNVDIAESDRSIKLSISRNINSAKEAVWFLENWNSPFLQAKAVVVQGIEYGVLVVKGNNISWSDGDIIISAPLGTVPVDEAANLLISPEGASTFSLLTEKLSNV